MFYVTFEFLGVDLMISVFWNVMPCLLVNGYRPFEVMCCLHHRGKAVQEELDVYFVAALVDMLAESV